MTAFEKMQLREQARGATVKDEMIYNARYLVDSLLPNDPSYKEGIEILNKGHTNLRMWNYKLVNARTTPQMDTQASLSEEVSLALGDVLAYDDGYWLCIDSHNRHGIERIGKVEECNYYLRWQNPETLEIHGRWCSIRDPSSLALDERAKVVVTGNARYTIKVPRDEETMRLHVDKRLLIDMENNKPMPYSVINFDPVSGHYSSRNEGFLILSLRTCQIREGDNHELMVADYIDPAAVEAPNVPDALVGSCTLGFSGSPLIRAGGSPKSFHAVFFDSNDNPLELTSPVIWELMLPEDLVLNKIDILFKEGSEIRLRATPSAPVGGSFILRMTASDAVYGNFGAELEINVGGIL